MVLTFAAEDTGSASYAEFMPRLLAQYSRRRFPGPEISMLKKAETLVALAHGNILAAGIRRRAVIYAA
jgi:hypothetical protein